ncbi:UDP-glucose 4-epimerase GalE [Egicoccus halophilus]|uniref:UDP-glucose 4-epimerase n=1 Tax=Egicoccus halophilus TaxID=1670830 RepID=A0A8J3A5I0_9ACTN|nr:UDP-glucose 4-epimerase GalE [Egicoccus halophilus]GGI03522.1 UDP-glucose 4-epimerase GalE [Egicoccus halophilus]
MRVLVTGGAGFIGATTAAALVDAGHDVTVVDDLSTGHQDAVPAEATFVRADVTDADALTPVVADGRFDACLHFAALIEAGESMRAPERFFTVNTAGSATLLRVLIEHGVERFVLSSTAAVYGEPERTPIDEDDALAPTNAYGESKLLVERMLAWHHRIHGLRTASLRYFNAAGATPGRPERHDPESHLIPLVLQVAAGSREQIAVFGTDYPTPDGTAVRDYVHVADLADAHVRAVEALADHPHLTLNLGNGRGFSVREVVEAAREVTGHPIPAQEAPRRSGDPATLVASSRRAADVLGWRPRHTDLHQIVADAWREGSAPA